MLNEKALIQFNVANGYDDSHRVGRVYIFDRTTKINIVDIMAPNSDADAGVQPFDADDGHPTATSFKNHSIHPTVIRPL